MNYPYFIYSIDWALSKLLDGCWFVGVASALRNRSVFRPDRIYNKSTNSSTLKPTCRIIALKVPRSNS
jgi:hypothetical protein